MGERKRRKRWICHIKSDFYLFFLHFLLSVLRRCGRLAPRQEEHHHVRDVALPGSPPKRFHRGHPGSGVAAVGDHGRRLPRDKGGTLSDPDSAALLSAGWKPAFPHTQCFVSNCVCGTKLPENILWTDETKVELVVLLHLV